MTVPIYKKTFSRDFSLAMLKVWYKAEAVSKRPWNNEKQQSNPYIVFLRENNTVKSYYDGQAVRLLKEKLIKAANKNPELVKTIEKEVSRGIAPIKPAFESGAALAKNELLEFIQSFEDVYPWVEAMWWLCEASEKELAGLDIANLKKLRSETAWLSSGTDSVVRKSLKEIFPKTSGFEHVVLVSGIKSRNLPKKKSWKKEMLVSFTLMANCLLALERKA